MESNEMNINNTWIRCNDIFVNLKWFMSHRFTNGISLKSEHINREIELSDGNIRLNYVGLDIIVVDDEHEAVVQFEGEIEYILFYNGERLYTVVNSGAISDGLDCITKVETDFDSSINRHNKRMSLIGDSSRQCTDGVSIINYTMGRHIRFIKSLYLNCDTIFRFDTFIQNNMNLSIGDCSFVSLRNVSILVKDAYLSTDKKEINLRYVYGIPFSTIYGESLLVNDNIKAEECKYIRMHTPNFKRIAHSTLELDKDKYLDLSNIEYIQCLYVVGDNKDETYTLDFKDKYIIFMDDAVIFDGCKCHVILRTSNKDTYKVLKNCANSSNIKLEFTGEQ